MIVYNKRRRFDVIEFKDIIQSADWKQEKHVPVIEAPDRVKKSERNTDVPSLCGRVYPAQYAI